MPRAPIAPFQVMEVMRAAEEREAAGSDVLHLEVGQPSTGAPAGAIAAAKHALDASPLGYTTAFGLPALRQAIADHYRRAYDVHVDDSHIAVTVGASGGCVLAFLSAFSPGDRVVVTEPGYPCYRNMLQAFDIEVVSLPVGPASRFQPTPELLDGIDGTIHGLVVASPSNPTGTMLDAAELESLVRYCDERDIRLIADEIYHGLTYGGPAPTAAEFSDRVVIVNSFSKYFSMTGWRLGWLVVPADLLTSVERLAQNLFISAPTLAQQSAIAAFECRPELDLHLDRYRANRDVVIDGLVACGIDDLAPADGAFYIYADVSHLTDDSRALCRTWLEELSVAVTPGIDFDPERGHRFVRFSFAGSTPDMVEAMSRVGQWVSGRG